jgi:hypothetical protein
MRFLCGWLVREINQEKSVAFRNCYRMQQIGPMATEHCSTLSLAQPDIRSDAGPDVWAHALHRKCQLCIEWGGANRPGMMGIPEASPGTARKSDR